jgi:hypothetical protein
MALLAFAAPARAANFTVTIATTGPVTPLSVITSTPSGIVCPGTCTASFVAGSTITLGEVNPSTVAFVGWNNAPGCRTNNPTCSLLVVAASTVTANFDPILSLAFSGTGIGVVSSTGVVAYSSAAAAGAGRSLVYPMGSTIVLNESTGTASSFTGWSGDGGCATASTCTITLNGYEQIIATFTATSTVGVSSFTIAVTIPNGGGTVTSTPAGINCPGVACSAPFVSGGSVSFTTAAAAGYRFAGWSNAGCSKNNKCVIVSTSPLQGLGGNFSPAAYFYHQ